MSDDGSDFENELLSGDDKWWEFMDPDTYEVKAQPVPTRASSALVDWSKKSSPRHGPTGVGFFTRCGTCGKPCPGDLTFCVYCGGSPKAPQSVYAYTIIIKDIENNGARDAVAELITEANPDLRLKEVTTILDELPAVFTVTERKDRIKAMLARFGELGAYGKSFNLRDPSIPWIWETLESISRSGSAMLLTAAIVVITLASAVFVTPGLFPVGLVLLCALFYYRLNWFRQRYTFDVNRVLDRCSGFDGLRNDIVDRLNRIRDKEMKQQFSVCLMEYYTLHTQFRDYESEYGDVLLRSDHALRELMDQIMNATGRYADLEYHLDGIEPAALNQRLGAASQRLELASATEAKIIRDEMALLKKEHTQYGQMRTLQKEFRRRMTSLAASMEALRTRVMSVKRERDARFDEIPMEDILRELDDELDVFVQTVQSIEA